MASGLLFEHILPRNKKGGKEAAATGKNLHFCPESRVPNGI